MLDRFDQIAALPQAVRDYLYSAELVSWYEEARPRWGLSEQQQDAIDDAVLNVYVRVCTIDQLVDRINKIVGDAKQATGIVIEIIGHDLLFIEGYLGINIAEYIRSLGGDPALYIHVADPEEVAGEIIKKDGTVLPTDPVVRHRLILAIVSFLTDARTRQQTRDVISRGTKIGGVGLSEDVAEKLCAAAEARKAELRTAGVLFRKDGGAPTTESSFHLIKPAMSSAIQPEDEAEIARIRQSMPSGAPSSGMSESINRVIARVGAKFKNEEAVKRFRSAIESRLRDIRDHQETFDILTRPTTAGGIGIPADRTEKVLVIVEEEFAKLHPSSRPKAGSWKLENPVIASEAKTGDVSVRSPDVVGAKEEAIPVKQSASAAPVPTPGLLPRAAPRNDKEESAPAMLPSPPPAAVRPLIALPPPPPVAELVHPVPPSKPIADSRKPIASAVTKPTTVSRQPQAVVIASEAKPSVAIPVKESANVTPKKTPGLLPRAAPRNDKEEVARVTPPLPAPKPLAAAPEPVKSKPVVTPPPIFKPLEASVPKPARPNPLPSPPPASVPSVSIRTDQRSSVSAAGRPRIQDVRSVPARLIGPVEELGRLTLEDFRKIAKLPGDAAARALEKIALLQKDSYTKRSEGIRAFRESPLMLLYADIVNTALLGKKTIESVVRERGVADRNSITIEELAALQILNAQLRF